MMPYQEEAVKFLTAHPKAILHPLWVAVNFSAIVAALHGGYKHILIIAPASVKKTWRKNFHYLYLKMILQSLTVQSGKMQGLPL